MAHDLTPRSRRDITTYGDGQLPPSGPLGPDPRLHGEPFGFDELWTLFWRNRWLILACVLVALAVAVVRTKRTTPIYQSSALVRLEDSATRSLTDNMRPERSVFGWGRSDEIETEMAVLRTYGFAESVADSLGLQVVISEPRRYTRSQVFSEVSVSEDASPGDYVLERSGGGFVLKTAEGRTIGEVGPDRRIAFDGVGLTLAPEADGHHRIPFRVLRRVSAARSVLGGLSVRRLDRDVAIIQIQYQSPDRDLTAEVPNKIADMFLVRRRTEHVTKASSAVEFLREQIDSLARQLRTAEEEIKNFQEREDVVALEAEGEATIEQVAALQGTRDAVQAESSAVAQFLRDAESRRATDPFAPSPYRRVVSFPSAILSPATATMLTALIQLENERAALLTRRKPGDPDVKALTDQIESMESQMNEMARTYHSGLSSQLASLESSIDRERGRLSTIPRKQVEMIRRQREAELLQQVYTLLQTKLKESEIAEAVQDPGARIVDRAAVHGGPIRPRPMLNLALSVILGLAAGFGLALLRAWRDRTVHTKEDVRAITGAPILGLIPRFNGREVRLGAMRISNLLPSGNGWRAGRAKADPDSYRLPAGADPKNPIAEAFRSLRTNITFTTSDRQPRTLLLTSATPGDGKTTTAVNLAHAFAQQHLRTLLVDADMRRGLIHELFGLPRAPGLSNLLVEGVDLNDAIRHVASESGDGAAFDVLPMGKVPPNPAEILASSEMPLLLQRLVERYDIVVIDTPPLSLVTDAAVLSRQVDSLLLVVRAGHTEEAALWFAVEQLQHVDAPIRGSILNDIDPKDRSYGGYYHSYYGSES